MTLGEIITSKTAVKLYVVFSALFILLFIADTWLLPWMVHTRAEKQIPDVSNVPFDKAARILSDASLKAVNAGDAPSSTVGKGNVLYQNPQAGSIVREGRNVYLTISGGAEQLIMPSLRGRSLRDAKITLERLNLNVGMISYDLSDLPAETVVTQSISAGRRVGPNRAVDLVVSLGKELQQLDVPYIVGLTLVDAQRVLIEHGLKLGNVRYKPDPNFSSNTIVAQSPSAGDKVDPNMPVDVTLVR
jgi:eukaryotic-like serine/threonine-protein kinase